VNDAAVLVGKPVVHGSIFQFEGQASVFTPHEGPCYRCLYPTPPPPGMVPSCSEVGVLGVLPGVIGVIPGDGNDQAPGRPGGAAGGTPADV
jgi:sulfur-carrier protein adenylyltransferase/sulfurtransferase